MILEISNNHYFRTVNIKSTWS